MSRSDRKFASPTKMKEETQPPAEISERNLWSETQRHSSSHRGHSPKWTDWDASDVKSKDRSGWPSWQFSQGENDMQKDDTISRDVRKISNSPTFDEQGYEEYGHSPDNYQNLSYRGRGRDRKRSRSRDRGRIRSPRRDENRVRGRGRNRSWERGRSRSRSRSPFRDLRHASYELTEKRSGSRMTSKPCRDFSVGKCRRGSQCGFSHHGNLNYRDGGSSENDLTERRRSRADDGGALTYGNNKWAADNPRDSISDGYRKYYEEDESLRDSRKDTLCCIDFLKGKCRRGASCRYPHHHNAAGDNYDTENKKVFYDQDVKREANKSGKYPCKYFSMGKCHRNDCRFSHDGPVAGTLDGRSRNDKGGHNLDDKNESWNGPKWGDDAGFPDTAKVTVREEDMKKSWNGPTWDDVAGFADESKATGWGDGTQTNYHGPTTADNRTDDKWCHSVEDESKVKGSPGGNEKVADRGEFLSHITETANAKGWGEDKKISRNDPQCDALKSPSNKPQPTGWGDSSFENKNSCDPMVSDEQNDDKWGPSLENERKVRGGPGLNEMATDGLKVLTSNRQNGRNGRSRDDRRGYDLDYKNKSRSGSRDSVAVFPYTAKATGHGEDKKKSWNGPTWDDVADSLDRPETTGWGGTSIGNTEVMIPGGNEKVADRGEFLSHITETANAKGWGEDKKISWNDPQCDALKSPSDRSQPTGWGDSSFKNKNSHDPMVADEQNDDKWGPSLENERKARGGPGWNEMATDGLKVLTSNRQNGRNGRSRDDGRGYDLDYKNKSRSGSRDAVAVFPYTAKATGHGEDKKKPWNGPTWDDVADSLDRPETTGWGGTSIGNKDSHDSTATEKPSNDRWGCSLGDERKARGGRGWKSRNEKAADGVEFLTSNQQNGGNRMSHDDRWAYNLDDKNKSQTGSRDATAGFPYNVKVKGQEEDKKTSWNGPTWDDVEDSLDRPKATGWGGSSTGNTDSHDPAAAEKQSDYNMGHSLAKKRKAMSGPGQTEKVSGRDDFLSSHWQKGSNGADKGITELIDSKMLIYGKEHQNNAQGSELQTLGGISTHVHEQNMIPDTSARQLDDTSMQPEIPEISYIQPHQIQGVDNSMAIAASSDAVNELQLSENDTHRTKVLGDSLGSPPPSSLSGTDQSCHKLSLKPSNFLNIDLNKSVQHKVSTLDSQNQAQIHCKEVVNTPEMTEFGDPQKSHIGQQNPPNTTGLVHPNSSKVSESGGLEVEYQESSMLKLEEAVAKPEVNVSNDIVTEDNRNNDKGEKRKQEQENIHLGGVDAHCKVEESQDEKAMRLFKISLVELVKEILNPTWKQGKMSKEVYKTIVKKAVDKVTSTIHGVQIPKTQEHIDHYISFSKLKISNLVEAYVEKFQNN